jgi:hypothetical protein
MFISVGFHLYNMPMQSFIAYRVLIVVVILFPALASILILLLHVQGSSSAHMPQDAREPQNKQRVTVSEDPK